VLSAQDLARGGQGDEIQRELADVLQKIARVQAKQGLRLDELDSKIEEGFADLRAQIGDSRPPTAADEITWDELLDAPDALEEAARLAEQESPAVASGLREVVARIERFLSGVGISRRAAAGGSSDGHLFRVVGAEPSAGLPDGVVARVVRAAVVRGEEILREGEVIVARRSA
jgi:molecular chaperone GrpE (heat shock protein)